MAKLKILAIEDDEAIIKLYELALTTEIFELKTARDGKEGLKFYKDWQPDINLAGHNAACHHRLCESTGDTS